VGCPVRGGAALRTSLLRAILRETHGVRRFLKIRGLSFASPRAVLAAMLGRPGGSMNREKWTDRTIHVVVVGVILVGVILKLLGAI